jgi:hypothetical protein
MDHENIVSLNCAVNWHHTLNWSFTLPNEICMRASIFYWKCSEGVLQPGQLYCSNYFYYRYIIHMNSDFETVGV